MYLSEALRGRYTRESGSAREAQRLAEFIAWGPVVFQVSRLMLQFGVLDALRDANGEGDRGLSREEIVHRCGISDYAAKCLLEASLSIGTVLVNPETECYRLSTVGWFLLTDPATRVNIAFNHDVNYRGMYHLDAALRSGQPAGLKEYGTWTTIYEALSSLPPTVQDSWFAFDHFYSDSSFSAALPIVFDGPPVRRLYDVGGNTGRWALQCVRHSEAVAVTVLDLPQQIAMMERAIYGKPGSERINGYGIDILSPTDRWPMSDEPVDAVWMSQFLDCFAPDEIVHILRRAVDVMTDNTRLYIMETLWDRQRYEPAAMVLTLTTLYFSAMANGNSKMYNTEDLVSCITAAGLSVEAIHDHIGQGHSILVCKKQ